MSVFGIKFPSFEKASHRTPIRRALSAFASPNAAIFRRSLFPAKRFFIARRVPLTLDLAGLSENRFPAIAVSANALRQEIVRAVPQASTNGDGDWAASADIVSELSRSAELRQPPDAE
jgi:hypothetical protein